MTFNNHIKTICKKAGQALCALLKISNYIDQNKQNNSAIVL